MKLTFALRFTSQDAVKRTLWSLSRLTPAESLHLKVLLLGEPHERESLRKLSALSDRGQIRAVCVTGRGFSGLERILERLDSDYVILAAGGTLFDPGFLSALNPELTNGSAIIKGRHTEDDWTDSVFVRNARLMYRGLETLVIRRDYLLGRKLFADEDSLFHSRFLYRLLHAGESVRYVSALKVTPAAPVIASRREAVLLFRVLKELAALWEKEIGVRDTLTLLGRITGDILRYIAAIEGSVALRKTTALELCDFAGVLEHAYAADHPETDACAALAQNDPKLTRLFKEHDSDRLCFFYERQQRELLGQSLQIRIEEGQAFERYYRTLAGFVLKNSSRESAERFELVTSSTMQPLYREQFENYFIGNPFLKAPGIKLTFADSTPFKGSLSRVYNRFIESCDLSEDAWLIFLHCDVEIIDDLHAVFKGLSRDCIYGPCGAVKVRMQGGIKNVFTGFNDHQRRDRLGFMRGGANLHYAGPELRVDTLDCLMVAVHTALLRRYPLRFDEHLVMDAVVEDFCMHAMEEYGVESRLLRLQCCHHSNSTGDPAHQSRRFYDAVSYVRHKYPHALYAGTCALLGGGSENTAFERSKAGDLHA